MLDLWLYISMSLKFHIAAGSAILNPKCDSRNPTEDGRPCDKKQVYFAVILVGIWIQELFFSRVRI